MHTPFEFFVNAQIASPQVPTHEHLHRAYALELRRSRQRTDLDRKRFYRLYRLRNLLYRLIPRLANRLAL